jgi:hypothetical protein
VSRSKRLEERLRVPKANSQGRSLRINSIDRADPDPQISQLAFCCIKDSTLVKLIAVDFCEFTFPFWVQKAGSTSANVKLLLPPRHSRGFSLLNSVRPPGLIISANVRRKQAIIARRAVYHCAPLHLGRAALLL